MNVMVECLTPLGLLNNLQQLQPQCLEIYNTAVASDAAGFTEYIPVFLLTCLLEFPVYFLFLWKESSITRAVLVIFLLNLATHPIVYLGMPFVFEKWDLNYLQYLLIAEVFAPFIEALLLKKVFHTTWKTAIWAALLANLFSWTLGVYWNS